MPISIRRLVVAVCLCAFSYEPALAQMRIESAGGSTPAVATTNTLCLSKTTKDSYFQEVGANNPGAYTNGTDCASGTLRFDWNGSRLNLLFAQGIATTSTDSLVVANATAATGGTTVQMSPRIRLRGNAWNTSASQTVDFFMENLPATAATPTGTFKLGYSLNSAAATYPLTVSSAGLVTSLAGMFATSHRSDAGGYFFWNGRVNLTSPADGQVNVTNAAESAGVGLDVATDAILKVRVRAQNAYALIDSGGYSNSGVVTISVTAPTIASGGCTSPAVTHNNGTAAFLITIGTSCTGVKTFTLTMPAASHFWACSGDNHTSDAQQQTNYIVARATSTTAVVVTSYDRVTGLQEDFNASDTYLIKCTGE